MASSAEREHGLVRIIDAPGGALRSESPVLVMDAATARSPSTPSAPSEGVGWSPPRLGSTALQFQHAHSAALQAARVSLTDGLASPQPKRQRVAGGEAAEPVAASTGERCERDVDFD
jgi:hypothetical protein